jgi:hypothetical protein
MGIARAIAGVALGLVAVALVACVGAFTSAPLLGGWLGEGRAHAKVLPHGSAAEWRENAERASLDAMRALEPDVDDDADSPGEVLHDAPRPPRLKGASCTPKRLRSTASRDPISRGVIGDHSPRGPPAGLRAPGLARG